MHEHFSKYLNAEELIRQASPRLVVELGAGSGENTKQLLVLCRELKAELIVISDGMQPLDLPDVDWRWAISYLALMEFPDESIDVALIDTDHNSWTVEQELRVLQKKMRKGGLMLLHDTESFATENGHMHSYGCGAAYKLEEILQDKRGYGEVVRGWIGKGFELVRETRESAGAMALRSVELM